MGKDVKKRTLLRAEPAKLAFAQERAGGKRTKAKLQLACCVVCLNRGDGSGLHLNHPEYTQEPFR